MTEDEMVGWHHLMEMSLSKLQELGWTGHKESDMTE